MKYTYWDNNDNTYVAAKYKDLKQEITQNTVCSLSIKQWNILHEYSTNYMESKSSKKYIPTSNGNNYKIYKIK